LFDGSHAATHAAGPRPRRPHRSPTAASETGGTLCTDIRSKLDSYPLAFFYHTCFHNAAKPAPRLFFFNLLLAMLEVRPPKLGNSETLSREVSSIGYGRFFVQSSAHAHSVFGLPSIVTVSSACYGSVPFLLGPASALPFPFSFAINLEPSLDFSAPFFAATTMLYSMR